MQRSLLSTSVLLLGLLAGACSSTPSNTAEVSVAPLYEGQMPSAMGQKALHKLRGVRFVDQQQRLGGGVWTVGGFSIADCGDGQLLPCVELQQGKQSMHLPMLTDGDVGFLFETAMDEHSPLADQGVSVEMKTQLRSMGSK